MEEASHRHAETERRLVEAHRAQLQDIATQQRSELERLAAEHEAALRWLEDKHRQDTMQQQQQLVPFFHCSFRNICANSSEAK